MIHILHETSVAPPYVTTIFFCVFLLRNNNMEFSKFVSSRTPPEVNHYVVWIEFPDSVHSKLP